MGCFLGCFGYSKKRKHRKYGNKVLLSTHKGLGSYEPLQPEPTVTFNITQTSEYEPRDKSTDQSGFKVKKKVSFNLNVRAYEPIPNDDATDYFSESNEKAISEKEEKEMPKASTSISHFEKNSTGPRMGPYPSNYRYQSCRDSYDEEDDIKLEESEVDDDDIVDTDEEDNHESDDDDDDDDDGDGKKTSKVNFSEQFDSLSTELAKRVTFAQSAEEKANNFMRFCALPDQELKKLELNKNARDRSRYVHSVLNPVENLTQWKAVKARAAPRLKQRKENIDIKQEENIPLNNSNSKLNHSKTLMQGIAVDASLSNWLGSSKTKSITNSSKTEFGAVFKEKHV